jgi:TolB-like protein/DNA-binding winged helix-turn-helix (wHTH) protein/Flp pilus assembly protein TadD
LIGSDFRLGEWVVRPQQRVIERGGESVRLKARSMSVLQCLAAAGGDPVSREELIEAAWRGARGSDDALTKCIGELRKAFGDSARDSRVIETVPRLGFCLLLPVDPLDTAPPTGGQLPGAPPKQRPRFLGFRRVGLLLAVVLVIVVASLSIRASRLWLTEAAATLYLRTSSILFPYSPEQKPGIAVLPFVNFSGDPENEYFSDGMSVEIINTLGRANRLPVIAQSSSFEFKNRQQDVKEIGRLLGVTHVLEGSVRRAAQDIRMTVQLIDSRTGTHVWSGVYQRKLVNILALQNEIASEIVNQIYLSFGDGMVFSDFQSPTIALATGRGTESPEAYDLYLQGMQMLRSPNPMPIERAADYFERAIALDPDYADAWAGKGLALYSLGRPGFGHPHIPATVYPGAIAALRKALEIEPGHTLATGWLGAALMVNDFKWAEGMRLMEESLSRNPNNAELWSAYGLHLRFMQLPGAEEALYTASRLNPYDIVNLTVRAGGMVEQGRFAEAAAMTEMLLLKEREGYVPNYLAATYNILLGRLDAGERHLKRARQVAHPDDLSLDSLQWLLDHRRGKRDLPSFAEQLERMKTQRSSHFVDRGLALEWEDAEQMVAAFDLAIEQRHPEMRRIMFGPKPELIPEADWRRMREITGVAEFQASR